MERFSRTDGELLQSAAWCGGEAYAWLFTPTGRLDGLDRRAVGL